MWQVFADGDLIARIGRQEARAPGPLLAAR
jgi:hypothetical protein